MISPLIIFLKLISNSINYGAGGTGPPFA